MLVVILGDYRLRGNDSKLLERSALRLRDDDSKLLKRSALRLREDDGEVQRLDDGEFFSA